LTLKLRYFGLCVYICKLDLKPFARLLLEKAGQFFHLKYLRRVGGSSFVEMLKGFEGMQCNGSLGKSKLYESINAPNTG